jgi:arginine N-succinyltransferase
MHLIRPIKIEDVEAFTEFAFQASLGMTSMPKNRSILKKKVEESVIAFSSPEKRNSNSYIFVLEDSQTHQLEGTSAINVCMGALEPFYFFKVELKKSGNELIHILRPLIIQNGPTELCSLFLNSTCRKSGLGRLLSFSRLLFIAAFPSKFEETIGAAMRGYFDPKEESPFWNGIGKHFYPAEFADLMVQLEKGKEFIEGFLPEFPIYLELLPREVQECAGKMHTNTFPAFKILQEEGFKDTDLIDLLDGGPLISAETAALRILSESKVAKIAKVVEKVDKTPEFILSNERLDFRAILAPFDKDETGSIILSKEAASALMVKQGDSIRYISPKREESHAL